MSAPAVEVVRGVAVARLEGEIDHSNGEQVERRLEAALAGADGGLVVDMSLVTFADSSAISALFRLARLAGERRCPLGLVIPPESVVERVLGVVALDQVVPTTHDLDAAVDGVLELQV